MKIKKGIPLLWSFAIFHFLMAVLGALEIKLTPWEPLQKFQDYYGEYAGTNAAFKFFAPNVGTGSRAVFEIEDRDGAKKIRFMERGKNSEADLRVGSIISFFWLDSEDPNLRRSLAASWAGKMFSRYPDSLKVTVKVQSYQLPPLEAFQKGEKPYWEDFYAATFYRKSDYSGRAENVGKI